MSAPLLWIRERTWKGKYLSFIWMLWVYKKKSNQSLFLENRCWVSSPIIYTKLSSDISFCCLKLLQIWIKYFLCLVCCKLIAPVRWTAHLGNIASYCILDSVFLVHPWKPKGTDAKEKPKTKQAPLLPEQIK